MLPEEIDSEERLARVACGSSKFAKNRQKFSQIDDEISAHFALFYDERTPAELSVNRISTLTLEQAHQLGVQHKEELQPTATYWGFAEVKGETCFELKCSVKKHDYGGKKPYHANLYFPSGSIEDTIDVANQLAFKAKFNLYTSSSIFT